MVICDHADCTRPKKPGKSKYCGPHATAAREAWKSMVADQAVVREARETAHQALFDKAHAAGVAAADATTPPVMVVQQHLNQFDDSSPVVRQWIETDGPCGFAWIKVTPGNCSFALWLKKTGRARASYTGGMQIWVSEYRQSLALKEAYAHAFADVLREAGIRAYAGSKMD